MTQELISNLNVRTQQTLSTPQIIKQEIPVAEKAMTTIINGRKSIEDILNREDKRLLVVVGPCSIHYTKAAMDYAEKLKGLSNEVAESMMLVMRVYFEKPRTTVGWKGLINDQHMDESFDIEEGLRIARKLLLEIN